MFDYLSSTNFMDQILQRMEQTVRTSAVSDTILQSKETCINENTPIHEKLVLKFTRCNLKVNEKKIKWKVSIPADLKNDVVKGNKSFKYNQSKTASADIITLNDIFNPLAQNSREKMRRLKQEEMDQVLCLNSLENGRRPEIKTKETKYSSDDAIMPCLSNYKNSFKEYMTNMAGFKKVNNNKSKRESNINFCSRQINEAILRSNAVSMNNLKATAKKRKLTETNLQFQNGRASSTRKNVKRPYKKRRVEHKTRSNCISDNLEKSNRKSERLAKKVERNQKLEDIAENNRRFSIIIKQNESLKPIQSKYMIILKRFIEKNQKNLIKDQNSPSKLIKNVSSKSSKRKLDS